MENADPIFDLLDEWRHLPDYQLERRADIFFAAHLPRFLSSKLKLDIRPLLIPEFPIRIGTISESSSNQSCKVDYLALDASGTNAIFVELKTDRLSRRDKQDVYLQAAKKKGLPELLDGVLKIVCASNQMPKYCCLLKLLRKHGLISLPENFDAALKSPHFGAAVRTCLNDARVVAKIQSLDVFYLLPVVAEEPPPEEIGFEEFANFVEREGGALSVRFAKSLKAWADIKAGYPKAVEN